MPSATPLPPLTQIDSTLPDQKLPTLHDFFHPGGILANSSLAFEHRAGQYTMAKQIEQSFADHRHLIVEAGTGTGKTLAYLLPALRRAREHKQRIIISTGTKNLQEQLFFKDIPFLESLLGPLRVCYMKGRANYICKQKLYALRDNPLLTGLEEISQFHSILQWERTTETGDRAEVDDLPEHSPLWHKLDARSEVCLGQTCPNWESCFITQHAPQGPRDPTSSSSTTTSSSPTSPSSSRPRAHPMPASSPKPPPSSSTKPMSSKTLPASTSASPCPTPASKS